MLTVHTLLVYDKLIQEIIIEMSNHVYLQTFSTIIKDDNLEGYEILYDINNYYLDLEFTSISIFFITSFLPIR